ncbi:MAG: response regulator [Chloroflexi bacterium]|nr:response regulator [Chloroflexota bacterium]
MSHPKMEKRVLIVDNDEGVRETNRELLEGQGYRVFVAPGTREELEENARILVQKERCHLVILDLRLYNDNDPDDWSGYRFAIRLIKDAPWVRCIFLTGYGSFELARRILGVNAVAIDIALKENGPAELVQMVRDVFQYKIACAWQQEFKWSGAWNPDKVLAPLVFMGEGKKLERAAVESEFVEILARLFPHADMLRLKKLGMDDNSISVAHIHSIVMRVSVHQNGHWLEDMAVKIGGRRNIETEIKNYDEYVKGQIGDFRYTQRYAEAISWHLGGIAYTLIGTNLEDTKTLKDYYRVKTQPAFQDLVKIFRNLFGELFKRWYAEPTIEYMNLWDHYHDALHLDDRHLARLKWGNTETLEFSEPPLTLPNPLKWIERNKHHSELETSSHTVHGDLHTRNIFVGPNKGLWLIDFERTGPGHCLRDFIEMETDIKFGLLAQTRIERKLYYAFEVALLCQNKQKLNARTISIPSALREHAELTRAYQIITRLRQLASNRIYSHDMRDYFWGLLGQTLFVATLADLSVESQWRAKLAAALICDRLENGPAWRREGTAKESETIQKAQKPSSREVKEKGNKKSYAYRSPRPSLHLQKRNPLDEEIKLLERRLQERKKQSATKGIDTPPEIIIEIEQLETKLQRLKTKRNRQKK